MKERLTTFIVAFVLIPSLLWGYVSLHTYTTGEILTATQLNADFGALNTGLDALQTEMKDSVSAVRTGIADSMASATKQTAINDSINARLHTTIPLMWTMAYGDSFVANDSLTVEISSDTPIGNAQSLYVRSAVGVPEKVKLIIDYLLPNNISKVDSIHTAIWTERTNGADFAAIYVYDDSTQYAYKVGCDSTGSMYSATARTTKAFSQAIAKSIVGGKLRIETIIQLNNSDSLCIAPLELIVTNR